MIATQFNTVSTEKPVNQDMQSVEILRNGPNPFIEMTLLWFKLPSASDVVLRIFDSIGCEVSTKSGSYHAGENHVILHRADLREPGLYSCRIETAFGTANRKLMML